MFRPRQQRFHTTLTLDNATAADKSGPHGHRVLDTGVCGPRQHNPVVFLDIAIGGRATGRLTIELRADIAPRAAENFRVLATGERGSTPDHVRLWYRGTAFHRIEPDGAAYGGDVACGDGTGRVSGLGSHCTPFPDENFTLRHAGPGVLSCVNAGPDSNAAGFLITLVDMPWLDGKQVAFGALVGEASYRVLDAVRGSGADEGGRPHQQVLVYDSGQLYPSLKGVEKRPGTADDAFGS